MKKIVLIIISFGLYVNAISQTLTTKKEYFDYLQTRVSHVWNELGDGTRHGSEKYYFENGAVNKENTWDKGQLKKALVYLQDGTVVWLNNRKNNDELEGEQKVYVSNHGTVSLQLHGIVQNGKVTLFEYYKQPNKLYWKFVDNGITQEYIEYNDDYESDYKTIKCDFIFKDGSISGKWGDDEISNGKFIKMKNEKNIQFRVLDDTVYVTQQTENNLIQSKKVLFKNLKFELLPKLMINMYPIMDFHIDYIYSGNNKENRLCEVSSYADQTRPFLNNLIWEIAYSTEGWSKNYTKDGKQLISEDLYKNNDIIYQKWYYQTGKLYGTWDLKNYKTYYENGNIKQDSSYNKKILYAENGSKRTEIEGNKFKVYDENGKIIDSDEIRVKYNELVDKYTYLGEEYQPLNDEINLRLKDFFCINNTTGEFLNVCYTKDNQYIFQAFQTLHFEFLKTWKDDYLQKYNNTIKDLGYSYSTLNWKSESQWIEKSNVLSAEIIKLSQNIELNKNFYAVMQKFGEVLASPEVKKTNKSLKDINDTIEIKRLLGL